MASQEQKDRLSQAAALINSILSPSAVQNIAASATVQPAVTARHVSVEGEITTVFRPGATLRTAMSALPQQRQSNRLRLRQNFGSWGAASRRKR